MKLIKQLISYIMKKIIFIIIVASIIGVSCSDKAPEADAWGNFEATEVMVSSQTNGQIISFPVKEGSQVIESDLLAVIDSLPLTLKLGELLASKQSVRTRISTINSQNDILKQQITNLKVDQERISKMLADGAATQKQFDDIKGNISVIEKQILASNTQKQSIMSELNVLDARIEQLKDQVSKSSVRAPSSGTIIQKYSEKGEITVAGKPILKIAKLDRIILKVYVSGGDLSRIKIGDQCKVRIDKGNDEYYDYTGKIIIVSDKAEFTPKIIQTREERVSMVYAVSIEVVNDGRIKSGMPGEAIFSNQQ